MKAEKGSLVVSLNQISKMVVGDFIDRASYSVSKNRFSPPQYFSGDLSWTWVDTSSSRDKNTKQLLTLAKSIMRSDM